jgi:hypothetical protein
MNKGGCSFFVKRSEHLFSCSLFSARFSSLSRLRLTRSGMRARGQGPGSALGSHGGMTRRTGRGPESASAERPSPEHLTPSQHHDSDRSVLRGQPSSLLPSLRLGHRRSLHPSPLFYRHRDGHGSNSSHGIAAAAIPAESPRLTGRQAGAGAGRRAGPAGPGVAVTVTVTVTLSPGPQAGSLPRLLSRSLRPARHGTPPAGRLRSGLRVMIPNLKAYSDSEAASRSRPPPPTESLTKER